MKIYISKEPSSEYFASDLYEDAAHREGEVEVTEEFWVRFNRIQREYWDMQDALQDLLETRQSMSIRGDTK